MSTSSKQRVDEQLADVEDQIDERDPKLYVEVNLGKNSNTTEKIVVYEGDTAESLAEEFALKHNLDKAMQDKLTIRLRDQINSVLAKIVEDEDNDTEEDEEDLE